MDGELRNWCLEYLVRNSTIQTNIINKLISTISVSNTNHRTKKTIILRTLEDALSEACIPESMLQILEYLEAGISNPSYGKAVERIWKGRVHDMLSEGSSFLVSDELKQWKNEIENSLLDVKVMEKLASMPNTRRDAIRKLHAFLAEAWENLGPSFLESVAQNQLDASSSVGVLQMNKQQGKEIQKENDKVDAKFTTTVDVEGVNLSTSCSKDDSVPINEVPENGESLKCCSVELQTLGKDPGLVIEDTNQEPQMENRSTDANVSEPQMENMSMDENVAEPQMENMSTDENVAEPPMENRSTGENVAEPQMENRSMDATEANLNETASVHQSDAQETASVHQCDAQETTSVHQSDAHRPNLMEPNTTARSHEWDDSIDGLQGETSHQTSKFSLPSPRRKKVSPLKAYEPKNITKRRRPKKWSKLEEDTLRTGVNKFGRGNWKLILNTYTFEERTEVDLKDKWRNMMRYGSQ
ncbi:unnamed protein product [Vicia faba]|uniref:Uncharacterized protein n=1 Tax=Vicia faba TaxID=3906 RepID=A0AAV1AN50_VICFA|nr:unnamed protein product [Vicia faba]